MKTIVNKNIILDTPQYQLTNIDSIEVFTIRTNVTGTSPDPNEMKLIPSVRITIFFCTVDVINSIQMAGKDILPTHMTILPNGYINDGKNIMITLYDNELCDDIIIDYTTKQESRENTLNKILKQ